MSPLRTALHAVVAAFLLALVGCGYSSGVRLPEGYEAIAVEYFGNDGPHPDLERRLHSRLTGQVARMVEAPLVSTTEADLLVRGRIVDYRRLHGIVGGGNELLDSGVAVTVEAWLFDPRLGLRLGLPVELEREVRYMVRVRGEEAEALDIALETLSQELVLDLLTQEAYEPEELESTPAEREEPDYGGRPD